MTPPVHSEIIGHNVTKDRFKRAELSHQLLGLTNIGLSRSKNQDALSYFHRSPDHFILAMADGLGSYLHSEKSSVRAVSEIPPRVLEGTPIEECCLSLHEDFIRAYPYEKKSLRGRFRQYLQRKLPSQPEEEPAIKALDCGSTTLVLADIRGHELHWGNIGDSRGYVFRDGRILFCTQDQSLARLIDHRKKIEGAEILPPPNLKGAILNSLGSPEPYFDFSRDGRTLSRFKAGTPFTDTHTLQSGDIVFLATDGVFTNLSETELCPLVFDTPWDELCETLEKTILRVMRMGWTNLGDKANPDNFSFIAYRHLR